MVIAFGAPSRLISATWAEYGDETATTSSSTPAHAALRALASSIASLASASYSHEVPTPLSRASCSLTKRLVSTNTTGKRGLGMSANGEPFQPYRGATRSRVRVATSLFPG